MREEGELEGGEWVGGGGGGRVGGWEKGRGKSSTTDMLTIFMYGEQYHWFFFTILLIGLSVGCLFG